MEHNATIIDLPIEIHYKYVRYIDLRDLASLIFTCKQFNELLGTDLQLQKIVYNNTEQRVLHKKLRRPIKQLFMENRAFYAVKIDDTEFLKYTLPSLSYKDIAAKLRPFSSDPKTVFVTKESTKSASNRNFLQKIFDCDAGNCFNFLLEVFTSDLPANVTTEVQDSHIYKTLLLLAIVCFKPLQALGSPSKLPYQKVLRVLLTHCHKWKELMIVKLVLSINLEQPNEDTLYSKMVFEALMACSKEFPEFHIDLNMKIPSISISEVTVETLLEYAAISQQDSNGELFHYLMNHGAQFDPKAPYLPLSLKSSPWSSLNGYLEKLGSDINALLKPGNETLLNSMLSMGWYDTRVLEYLLYKGAKLTKEEEARWLATAPNSFTYKVAKCQQTEYNPLKTVGEIPEVTDARPGFYAFYSAVRIELYYGRRFKYKDSTGITYGNWEVKEGKLLLQDTHKWTDDGIIERLSAGTEPTVRSYSIIRTCLGLGFGLAIDDPELADEERIKKLLFAYFEDDELYKDYEVETQGN